MSIKCPPKCPKGYKCVSGTCTLKPPTQTKRTNPPKSLDKSSTRKRRTPPSGSASASDSDSAYDSVSGSTQTTKVLNSSPQTKKRKTCETNAMELVVAFCVAYPSEISNMETLKQTVDKYKDRWLVKFNNSAEFNGYNDDLKKRTPKLINPYISIFNKEWAKSGMNRGISEVFVGGKKCSCQKIQQLNQGLDKKETKADVYVKYNDGKVIGISVKQDPSATKCNYSINILLELDKDQTKLLNDIKKQIFIQAGFPEFKKADRPKHSKLFYTDNLYWREAARLIVTSDQFKYNLYKYITGIEVPYPLFEFNGKNLYNLNSADIGRVARPTVTLTYDENSRFLANDNPRSAAKIFFRFSINDNLYWCEIRWKGDMFNAAPQIHVYGVDSQEGSATYHAKSVSRFRPLAQALSMPQAPSMPLAQLLSIPQAPSMPLAQLLSIPQAPSMPVPRQVLLADAKSKLNIISNQRKRIRYLLERGYRVKIDLEIFIRNTDDLYKMGTQLFGNLTLEQIDFLVLNILSQQLYDALKLRAEEGAVNLLFDKIKRIIITLYKILE